ncbi:hypothetical protein ALC56_13338 [Trachymyrmex septentrionalis]|uniref:Uncharacterized protein n=1 Tax=Trachymyrmex septentrionalis TaxID=34720 RepID=A0A195EW36_9HYME|nr:hypothetical protein ALC56_13338 [Trachymyrmex septentrionalis]
MTSSPMQVNNSSKEFIISMLRPFCLPIRAPYTESTSTSMAFPGRLRFR